MNYLSNIFPKNGRCAVRLRPEHDARSAYQTYPLDVAGWFCIPSVRELPTNRRQPSPVAGAQGSRALNLVAHADGRPLGSARFASALWRA
jgi:hypothetical protein